MAANYSTVLPVNGKETGQRYGTPNRLGRLRAFADEQAAYDAGMWLRAMTAREFHNTIDTRAESYLESIGLQVTTVSKEGSGPGGGFLVPAPLSNTLIQVLEKVGVSRQICRILPAPSNTLAVPKRAGGLTVYYPEEAQTITDSTKNWSQVGLTLQKRAVATLMSMELVEDAIISVADDAVAEMGYALALQEDNELINGDGTSSYGGVQGLLSAIGSAGVSTAASGHTTWASLDIADMTAFIGKLPDRYFTYGASFVCSYSFFNQVMARIAFQAGGVQAAEIFSGQPNVRSFLGYPVYLTSRMPTTTATGTVCCLFGAFNQAAILATRGDVRMARSDQVKFLEDQVALKTLNRYDFAIHDAGTSSAAGAYVALKTNQ